MYKKKILFNEVRDDQEPEDSLGFTDNNEWY